MELRREALRILALADPAAKAAAARAWGAEHGTAPVAPDEVLDAREDTRAPLPGRPPRPRLVHPSQVPRRTPFTPEGRAALLHAVAHIEFNAIK